MHFESRLWAFTKGLRLRIVYAVVIGLAATVFGIARLALLGWLIGRIFAGDGFGDLLLPLLAVGLVVVFARRAGALAAIVSARDRRQGATAPAPPAVCQGGRARPRLRRPAALRRRDAVAGRRRGTVGDIFRAVHSAAHRVDADAAADFRLHRLAGFRRRRGGAGLCVRRPVCSRHLAPSRCPQIHRAPPRLRRLCRRVARFHPGTGNPQSLRPEQAQGRHPGGARPRPVPLDHVGAGNQFPGTRHCRQFHRRGAAAALGVGAFASPPATWSCRLCWSS